MIAKLSTFLVLALFILITPWNTPTAQAQEKLTSSEISENFKSHLNLFSDATIRYWKPLINKDEKKVTGLAFVYKYKLTRTPAETWKYIKNPDSTQKQFILQMCLEADGSNCWYSKVLFAEEPSATAIGWFKDTSGIVTNFFLNRIPINFVLNLFNSGIEAPESWTKQYGLEKQEDLNSVFAIFKKDGSKNCGGSGCDVLEREINIFATDWYTLNATGGLEEVSDLKLLQTKRRVASIWYCGIDGDNSNFLNNAENLGVFDDSRIQSLNGLCGSGTAYFKIAQTSFTPPLTWDEAVTATASNTVGADPNNTITSDDGLPVCEILTSGSAKIVGCLALLVHYGLYWPLAWIAGLFGSMFDFFIGYSLSDTSYRYAFAETGWRLVRDIANIFFIIILIYTGFSAVFSFGGRGGATMKKVVPALIINALIINFSLFATRTVIDVSNIAARIFYSQMIVCSGECKDYDSSGIPANIKRGLGGYWPLSEKIVASFEPQKLLSPKVLQTKETEAETNDLFGNSTAVGRFTAKGFDRDSEEYAGYYALVSLLSAGIMLAIAAMFFKVMFMFLGRVVGLYIAMIFSPFAFLTRGGGGGFIDMKNTGWDWSTWAKNLITYAALAPIFTFFLYIIYSFLTTDFVAQIGIKNEGGFFGTVLSIVIPMLLIYKLIDYGATLAKKYAGDFGMMAQNMLGKLTGLVGGVALGAATGGVALAGRATAGTLGKAASRSGLASWAANSNTRFGRSINSGLNKLQTSSFDIRNSSRMTGAINKGLGQLTGGALKVNTEFGKGTFIGKDMTAGGVVGYRERREKVREKDIKDKYDNANYSHLSKDEIQAFWSKRRQEKIDEQTEADRSALLNESTRSLAQRDLQTNAAYLAQKTAQQEMETRTAQLAQSIATLKTTLGADNVPDATKTANQRKIEVAEKELQEKNIALQQSKTVTEKLEQEQLAKKNYTQEVRESEDFKKKTEALATSTGKKIDDEYGKIEDAKDFAKMMAYDHAKKGRENSFWMKGGENAIKNFRTGRGGIAAIAGGALAGAATAGVGVGVAMTLDALNTEMESYNAATKKILKDYKNNKKRFTNKKKKEDYTEEMVDNQNAINDILRKKVANDEAVAKLSIKEQQDIINEFISNASDEYELITTDHKAAEKAYLDATSSNKPEAAELRAKMHVITQKKRKQKDIIDRFKNILKQQETLQSTIDKLDKEESDKAEKSKAA